MPEKLYLYDDLLDSAKEYIKESLNNDEEIVNWYPFFLKKLKMWYFVIWFKEKEKLSHFVKNSFSAPSLNIWEWYQIPEIKWTFYDKESYWWKYYVVVSAKKELSDNTNAYAYEWLILDFDTYQKNTRSSEIGRILGEE